MNSVFHDGRKLPFRCYQFIFPQGGRNSEEEIITWSPYTYREATGIPVAVLRRFLPVAGSPAGGLISLHQPYFTRSAYPPFPSASTPPLLCLVIHTTQSRILRKIPGKLFLSLLRATLRRFYSASHSDSRYRQRARWGLFSVVVPSVRVCI